MANYSETLSAFLRKPDTKQAELADAIGKTQASVSRYATGLRTPDRETAEAIDRETAGAVPFSLWQHEAAERIGIAA